MTAPPDTELWIMDEIGEYGLTARQFVADLKVANGGPVTLRVSSPGGEVFDGLAIFEAIRSHPGPVTAYVDGLAASAASVIIMAADEIVMAPNAMIMCHSAACMTWGNEEDHLRSAALLGKVTAQLAAIYAARTGKSAASWQERLRGEEWFTASEAVSAGLADRVAEVPVAAKLAGAFSRLRTSPATSRRAPSRDPGPGQLVAALREGMRAGLPGHPVAGVVVAQAGGPARRPTGRRAAPSAMPVLRALRTARR